MKLTASMSFCWLLVSCNALNSAEIELAAPLDYQVIQRDNRTQGKILIRGTVSEAPPQGAFLEARIVSGDTSVAWRKLETTFSGKALNAQLDAAAGGWYRVELRLSDSRRVLAETAVDHVGVGEVFVVAGQSNSANHGEVRQLQKTGRVTAFDGSHWKLANDPQPGASGDGGSFIPAFADAIVSKFNVPVGIVACGIGATSVREWLPKGSTFPNPPTIEDRVERLSNGEWASKGDAFAMFVARTEPFGSHGFRAVLWHQGESDANQRNQSRTLPGEQYAKFVEIVIDQSRNQIGWDAPWFVAQASYHVPGDEGSAEIRDAQSSLWKEGIALEGPDTDALKNDLREANGQGVHFSAKGLVVHGAKWADKVGPWLQRQISKDAK